MEYKIAKESDLINKGININYAIYSQEYFNFVKNYFKANISFLLFEEKGELLGVLPVAEYMQNNLRIVGTLPKTNALMIFFKKFAPDFEVAAEFLKNRFSNSDLLSLRLFFLEDFDVKKDSLKETSIFHAVSKISNNNFMDFFDKKTRNQTRRSLEASFEIKEATLEEIYKLYLDNMRRHGTPPKEFTYFKALKENLVNKIVFLSVFSGDKICGINIFYINGDYLLLLNNLSYPEFWPERINNFLYLKTIEYGYERGVRNFDFGPSTEKDVSHLDFKTGFGGKFLRVYEYLWYKNKVTPLIVLLREKARNIKMRFLRLKNIFK